MDAQSLFLKELASLGNSVIWAIVGIFLLWVSYKVFEAITPFDDWKELEKGNVAVAVFFASIFIAVAIIIAAVIASS